MQDTMQDTMAPRHRPLGVTIMAILLGIQGFIELIGGMIIPAIIFLYFLLDPNVRRAFRV